LKKALKSSEIDVLKQHLHDILASGDARWARLPIKVEIIFDDCFVLTWLFIVHGSGCS